MHRCALAVSKPAGVPVRGFVVPILRAMDQGAMHKLVGDSGA